MPQRRSRHRAMARVLVGCVPSLGQSTHRPPAAGTGVRHGLSRWPIATGQVLTAGAMSRACILDADWTALDKWIAVFEPLAVQRHRSACLRKPCSPGCHDCSMRHLLANLSTRDSWNGRSACRPVIGAQVDCNEAVLAGFSLMMYYNSIGDTSSQEHLVRQLHPLLANSARGSRKSHVLEVGVLQLRSSRRPAARRAVLDRRGTRAGGKQWARDRRQSSGGTASGTY